jgi:hypothetical protein
MILVISGIFLCSFSNDSNDSNDLAKRFSNDFLLKRKTYKTKRYLKKEITKNPNNLQARSYLAIIYFFQSKNNKAIDEANIVLKTKDDINMYNLLDAIYSFSNQIEKRNYIVNMMYLKYPNDINVKYEYVMYILMPNKDYGEVCKIIASLSPEEIIKEANQKIEDARLGGSILGLGDKYMDLNIFDDSAKAMIDGLKEASKDAGCR